MNHSAHRPNVITSGHYVGVEFEQGWFFFNAIQTEEIELKPYTLLNENGNRAEIAAATAGSEDDEIVDQFSRELVEPSSSEQNLIFQVLFGVAPSRVQIFPRFGRDRSPNLRGGAEPGEPQIAFNGYDSPYNDPSSQAEMFMFNDMNDLQLQAYNPMSEPTEARISAHVNKIRYTVVEDVDLMRAFLDGKMRFTAHSAGLGAQSTDRIRAPGWLTEKFGDVIYTTQEIYQQSEASAGSSGGVEDVIPGQNMS